MGAIFKTPPAIALLEYVASADDVYRIFGSPKIADNCHLVCENKPSYYPNTLNDNIYVLQRFRPKLISVQNSQKIQRNN